MDTKELNSKIAGLETQVDILESELCYLDQLLIKCGFPEGVQTLKKTVEELLSSTPSELPEDGSELV